MNEKEPTLGEYIEESSSAAQPEGRPKSRFWGRIPEAWDLSEPSDVYQVNPNPTPDEEPITYIEMDALDTELPWPRYFGERIASEYGGKTFTTGDTLFARITPSTENGKAAIVPEMETQVGIGSTEFAVLSPYRDRIHPWYLYYVSKSHPVHDYAISRMRGSTGRQRVPFSVFRRELDIALPPPEEQYNIATVLVTVDQLIKKSREIIIQTRRVREGLLQDLIERGLDTGGDLRDISIDDSSNFSKQQMRNVPSDWKVMKFADVGEWKSGTTPKRSESSYWGGSLPWITAKDMKKLRVGQSEDSITEKAVKDGAKVVSKNSLLILVRGMVLDHTLPLVRPKQETSFNQDVKAILPYQEINPDYLAYWLESNSEKVLALVTTASHGTKRLATEALGNLSIPIPPLEEQTAIVDRVEAFDDLILEEKSYVEELIRLKRGLLQDLLSGEVLTHDKDIEILDEVLAHG